MARIRGGKAVRSLILAPAVVLLFAPFGCGVDASQAPRVEEEPAPLATAGAGETGEPEGTASGGTPSGLPEDFPLPLPPRYEVEAAGRSGDETDVVLRVPSGREAYDFYGRALEEEGFRVQDLGATGEGRSFDADLYLFGDGYEGDLDFDADAVEIDLERE